MSRKLREALTKVSDVLETWCDHLPPIIQDEAKAALALADEALADTPRNCELYDTKDESREAFQNLRGHRVLADVSLWDDRDEIEAMFDWLFAKEEGGAK